MDSAVCEGRRGLSGRVVHVVLELDAQGKGRRQSWDGREVYIIIDVIKIGEVRVVGRKTRETKRNCEKGQGHRQREKVTDDSGLKRTSLRKMPGDPGI